MKRKIGYVCLILISIIGSRLIFGRDYHLNSENLVDDNLYVYDIFENKEATLLMTDDEDLYYILSSGSKNKVSYQLIKRNLTSNKIISEYNFNSNYVYQDIQLFIDGKYLYLTANNSNVYYKLNKNLDLVDQKTIDRIYDTYGISNENFITTKGNQIFKNGVLYDTLPNSCGKNMEAIYSDDVYLHFHNSDTGFGCLYNIKTKKREYLDYRETMVINDSLLEYQDNRLSFKYRGDTYYFNDITESDNLVMHDNSDYLFTVDTTSNTLKIYNLETQKIIYNRDLIELKNCEIKDILIDDYIYFTVIKDKVTKLYVWDYLKEKRNSKDMISYNEKEYKFKNNELKEEIKEKYNIDVYIYDQAVKYFDGYYVIPSYDDILINSRLITLKELLDNYEIANYNKLVICLEKDILSGKTMEKIDSIVTNIDGITIIAVSITNDNFQNIMMDRLNISNLNNS